MTPQATILDQIGALCFGIVIGYITYRTLARAEKTAISDLAAVIGAVGGAAVTGLFDPGTEMFAWYAIGLLVGMSVFFLLFGRLNGKKELAKVMGGSDKPVATRIRGPTATRGDRHAQPGRTARALSPRTTRRAGRRRAAGGGDRVGGRPVPRPPDRPAPTASPGRAGGSPAADGMAHLRGLAGRAATRRCRLRVAAIRSTRYQRGGGPPGGAPGRRGPRAAVARVRAAGARRHPVPGA